MNEVGEVMWHSLDKDGIIKIYDIYWGDQGIVEHNIPTELLERVKEQKHKKEEGHGVQSEDTPIDERKKKRKERKKRRMPSGLVGTMSLSVTEEVQLTEGLSEDAKKLIADWIRSNKEDLSEMFPYGTQTVAEMTIDVKADEIANCIIDLVNPF